MSGRGGWERATAGGYAGAEGQKLVIDQGGESLYPSPGPPNRVLPFFGGIFRGSFGGWPLRRSTLCAWETGRQTHFEVAAVISVLGLVVMGRPLLAGGLVADGPLTVPATAGLVPATAAPLADAQTADIQTAAHIQTGDEPPAELVTWSADDPLAWFPPGGRNQGTENLAAALAAIALADNPPLYVSDGWGRTWARRPRTTP